MTQLKILRSGLGQLLGREADDLGAVVRVSLKPSREQLALVLARTPQFLKPPAPLEELEVPLS